ncbi:MAG: filamentous hemagglutinin N-terminal domain-containing protein [Symploca sp. SIO2B6]|nr:filamentous hemagglutinin N-terminal domain-containing protein [Symploca sp. SIO2B6]
MSLLAPNPIQAQIIPDNSLPDNSVVTPNGDILQIDGGTTAGNNLFHSFEQFSVPKNNTAFFNNALDIQNILSRVTGSSISEIDGILKANGSANLFLINPNGIIFGANASLDLGGSFFASTASSINFADGTQFSATDTNSPPLLTVTAPIGLGLGTTPASITNQLSNKKLKLEVSNGQTLALIGGDVSLNRANLKAPEGRIEIGGLAAAGNIEFNDDGSFSFPEDTPRADVSLANRTVIEVNGGVGGTINFNVANLEIVGKNSRISAGIKKKQGSDSNPAGDIQINATGDVTVTGTVDNATLGEGDAGDILVTARNLTIAGKGRIRSFTTTAGNAGEISIDAHETVRLIDWGKIQNEIEKNATGNGGDINIRADSVLVEVFAEKDQPQIRSLIGGSGDGGNINIEANYLSVIGRGQGNGGAYGITANAGGTGKGGDINITVDGAINLTNRGKIEANANNRKRDDAGDGGDINIVTQSLSLSYSGFISAVTKGQGNAGNIFITSTGPIEIRGGSSNISTEVKLNNPGPSGNGGDITIYTQSLLTEGGFLNASTQAEGNAGDIHLHATDFIELSGVDGSNRSSGLFTRIRDQATGKGGNIHLTTPNLRLSKFAVLNAASSSESTQGIGGNIFVDVDTLELVEGSQILTTAFGNAAAGDITIKADKEIILSGNDPNFARRVRRALELFEQGIIRFPSDVVGTDDASTGLLARSRGAGDAGDLTIFTPNLTVQDGAEVTVSATEGGSAGNLMVEAESIFLDNGSLRAEIKAGKQGNIILNTEDIILRRGSGIITNATDTATGGNITINTDILAALEDSDITARAVDGRGGNIKITTQGIFLSPDSKINASSQRNIDGTVTITTPEVDPTSGILELPSIPIDAESLVAQNHCAMEEGKIAGGSSFIVTGKGGLAPSSDDPLTNASRVVEWASRPSPQGSTAAQEQQTSPVLLRERVQTDKQEQKRYPVIEQAQGWIVAPNGTIMLTASVPTFTPQTPGLIHPHCRSSSLK